jgi:hypothetical protein
LSIFKNISSNALEDKRGLIFRLPLVESRIKSEFNMNDGKEKEGQKMVKIALDRLKPL